MKVKTMTRRKTRTVVMKREGQTRPLTPRAVETTAVRAPKVDAQKIHMKVRTASPMAAFIAPTAMLNW